MNDLTAAQQLIVDELAAKGMHPVTAHNVVQDVVERGSLSPWFQQIRATAVVLAMRLYLENVTALLRAAAPAFQQLLQAMGRVAKGTTQAHFELVDGPPSRSGPPRPAWQSPYGPPTRRR